MQLTKEQEEIINSTGDIKINAVAGSGKTTTIIEYAKTRPRESKILYLAFNKSVKLEAQKKFTQKGIDNVIVETAHSLAYRSVVFKNNYKVKNQEYKSNEIAEILNLQGNGEKHYEYVIANHISKFCSFFCNSDKQKISELNYLELITEKKAVVFVKANYRLIEAKTRIFLSKMNSGEIEVTHEFYLKKFQLSNPIINVDYILFDEGQDASPVMLAIFLSQKATKVIVGDTHQQIYSWRFAVNSLEKVKFQTFNLSTSFRFSQDIANLAMGILNWKTYVDDYSEVPITGKGESLAIKSKAILARTNLALLLKAIEYVTESKKIKKIYFEGNINSYTYADDGASLYDVLNLYNFKHPLIKDKLIKSMSNIDDLEEYIEKTEDVQLGMMVEIVREYGSNIPAIIKKIKDLHVDNDKKHEAEMIFSTVHRSKGMEYDSVQLVNDFISEEKIKKVVEDLSKKNNSMEESQVAKINEEINLLYVAITRTKNSVYIPASILPLNFQYSKQIHSIKTNDDENGKIKSKNTEKIEGKSKVKAYILEDVREEFPDAYRPWSPKLDDELTVMYCEGVNVKDLAKHFNRTKGSIYSRIKRLELIEIYG